MGMTLTRTDYILEDVDKELRRQTNRWGVQNHESPYWYAILGEEFGEVGRAIAELGAPNRTDLERAHWTANLKTELVQVAAVAVAMVECIERHEVA